MMSRDQKHIVRKLMNDHNLNDLLIAISLLCREHAAKANQSGQRLHALEWEKASILIEQVTNDDAVHDLSERH